MATTEKAQRRGYWRRIPIGAGTLKESTHPARMNPGDLQIMQNLVYRRLRACGKRTGTGPYGNGSTPGTVGTAQPVISGTRFYRGAPAFLKQMIVQSGGALYVGNDVTGGFTLLGALPANATPAFFASAHDTAESAVIGSPASDILIVAYGSGPPMKYDGTQLTQLSPAITNNFTGCETYHQHVALWGDPANPDTVFFTDLANPESYTFSTNFGGYQIAVGDGDPFVQRCIRAGESLFVFKNNDIYLISGYDFQSGEYQFSDEPYATDVGIPSPFAVTRLRTRLFFWSGQDFFKIEPGAGEPEPIGTHLINTIAAAAGGNQAVIRATAGSFLVQGPAGPTIYNDVVLFAIDDGTGIAQKILVYDDYASRMYGEPCWSIWTGFSVGAFIPWLGTSDQHLLYIGSALNDQVSLLGQNATSDAGIGIPVMLQTFRDDFETPDQEKVLDEMFVEVESGAAVFTVQVLAESDSVATKNIAVAGAPNVGKWGSGIFGTSTFGTANATQYQAPLVKFGDVFGRNFAYIITENSPSSAYEILGLNQHVKEDSYAA